MSDVSDALTDRSQAAAVANLTVRLFSQYTGRGPTKARTYIAEDLVTVVLQDTLTAGERTLIHHDYEDVVLSARMSFQEAMSEELTRGVEEIVQRKVIAFLSANRVDPDCAIESFILAPKTQPGSVP